MIGGPTLVFLVVAACTASRMRMEGATVQHMLNTSNLLDLDIGSVLNMLDAIVCEMWREHVVGTHVDGQGIAVIL